MKINTNNTKLYKHQMRKNNTWIWPQKLPPQGLKIGPGVPGNPRDGFKITFKEVNFSKKLGKMFFPIFWHRFSYSWGQNPNSASKIIQGYRFRSKFWYLSIKIDFLDARHPTDYNFCGHKTSGGSPFGPGTHGTHGAHGAPCTFCGHIHF